MAEISRLGINNLLESEHCVIYLSSEACVDKMLDFLLMILLVDATLNVSWLNFARKLLKNQ